MHCIIINSTVGNKTRITGSIISFRSQSPTQRKKWNEDGMKSATPTVRKEEMVFKTNFVMSPEICRRHFCKTHRSCGYYSETQRSFA
jgi:hypothetical protein